MKTKAERSWDGRNFLSDFLILSGVLILFTVSLFWARSALAAHQDENQPFLISKIDLAPPLPAIPLTPSPSLPAATATEILSPAVSPITATLTIEVTPPITQTAPTETPEAILPTETPLSPTPDTAGNDLTQTPPPADNIVAPTPSATEMPPPPTPAPGSGPVIRLVIPRLQVDRAVVPVELRRQSDGSLNWNTDALFSTQNRSDLVGQLAVSSNPGEGGNTILVGHNYNNGWIYPEGAFVRLQNLQPGDEIVVYTSNGGEFHYTVQKVKKVPWQKRDQSELEKHEKYLWPTDHEQLTLVTCGGVNVWTWLARIYVVAVLPGSVTP